MDPLQNLIGQEVIRRSMLDPGAMRPMGGIAPPQKPSPSFMQQVGEALIPIIPRVGIAARALNAGPVADGTLDYARRMGWMR